MPRPRFSAVLALLLGLGCTLSQVMPLQDQQLECGCWYWRAGDPQRRELFQTNLDSVGRINLQGREMKAVLVSEREIGEELVLETYALDNGGTVRLAIRLLEKEYLEADWGPVEATMTLETARITRVLKLQGGCGC